MAGVPRGLYHVAFLLQEHNFNDQWDSDEYALNQSMKPFIRMRISAEVGATEKSVESIKLVMATDWDEAENSPILDPLNIFSERFWSDHWAYAEGNKQEQHPVDLQYYTPNIWNEYCLFVGNTTIPRNQFCLWLENLRIVVHGSLDCPYTSHWDLSEWQRLSRHLKGQTRFSEPAVYFDKTRWEEFIGAEKPTAEAAFDRRLLESRDLLNKFFPEITDESPLEKFLVTCFKSFGDKLCEARLLQQCAFCSDYMIFRKSKKYCSPLTENKDCGRAARNKRSYTRHQQSRQEKSKQNMCEDRRLLRKHGLKK